MRLKLAEVEVLTHVSNFQNKTGNRQKIDMVKNQECIQDLDNNYSHKMAKVRKPSVRGGYSHGFTCFQSARVRLSLRNWSKTFRIARTCFTRKTYICKYARMQVCKCASMQVYKYAGMQVCKNRKVSNSNNLLSCFYLP